MRLAAGLAAALLAAAPLAACNRPAPASPAAPAPSAASAAPAGVEGKGPGTFASPVMRCGPRESYAYVAREFRCHDGTNPFQGQLEAAAKARLGGRHHPGGHIVDLYKVPCPGGDETVFVDMYGCAEAQALLDNKPSADFLEAEAAFERGDFERSARLCFKIIDGERFDQNVVRCLSLAPAAMALSGGEAPALRLVGGFCSKMDNPSTGPKVRRDHVLEVARWLARGAARRLTKEQYEALVARFVAVCGLQDDGQGALRARLCSCY